MAKRKRLNRRVAIVVLILGVIFVGALTALVIERLPKDPSSYLRKVDAEMAKEHPNWKAALSNINRAIRDSGDQVPADLYYRKAELCFDRYVKDTTLTEPQRDALGGDGYKSLQMAIQRDPGHRGAHRKLAELLLSQAIRRPKRWDLWQDYIKELDTILAMAPDDADAYYKRGFAYQQLSESEPQYRQKALENFRKAVDLDKNNVEYWNALTRSLASSDQLAEADRAYREAIAINPNQAQLRVYYASFLAKQGEEDEAMKNIQDAIDCQKDSPIGYLTLASYSLRKKELDPAEQALKKAQAIDNTDLRVYTLFTQLYRQKNDLPSALRTLQEGLQALEQQSEEEQQVKRISVGRARALLNYWLADVYMDIYNQSEDPKVKENALARAKEYQKVLLSLSPYAPRQYYIAGRIAVANRQWTQAREALEKAVVQGGDPKIAALLITVYNRLGIPGQSEKLAQQVLRSGRLSPAGQVLFLLQLAQYRLNAAEYDLARQLVEQALRIDPNNERAQELQRALNIYAGKIDTTAGDEISGMARAMLFRKVQEYVLDEQFNQAQEILENLLEQNPSDLQALSQLSSLLMQNQKKDEALAWIEKALQTDPENANLKQLKTLLQESDVAKRYQIEIEALDRLADTGPLEIALRKWNLAHHYGRAAEAESYLREAEKINPNHRQIIAIRFRQALAEKNWKQAREWIDRISKEDAGARPRDFFEARLKIAQGDDRRKTTAETPSPAPDSAQENYTQAISHLHAVLKANPHLALPRLLLAECYEKIDRLDDARREYRTCYDNNPQNVQAMAGLARLAQRQEQASEYEKWIREAYQLPAGKAHPYVSEQYLQLLEAKGDNLTDVIRKREQILKRRPDDLSNAYRLAALYEKNKQVGRAQEMIEYVFNRTPNKIAFAPMLAELYLRMNHSSKADALFSDLLEQAKTSAETVDVLIAYAGFLTNVDSDAALRIYDKAIAEEGDAGAKALQALSHYRASRAQLLAQQGREKDSQKQWDESIRLIRSVIEKQPENQNAKRILLQRYIDARRYSEAIAGYQNLLQADPDDAQARLGLGLAYLQNNQLSNAEAQFDRVIEINPDAFQAYLLRSQVHRARMELRKAAEDMRKATELTGNIAQRMDLAWLYEAMNEYAQAGHIYDAILAVHPEFFPAYQRQMQLQLRQKQWSAAEALAKKAMGVFDRAPYFPLVLATAAEEQGQTKEKFHWLQTAAEMAPDDPAVVRRYLMALLENKRDGELRREARRYQDNPKLRVLVRAILLAARAQQTPRAAGPFQEMSSLLGTCTTPSEVNIVANLMRTTFGDEKIIAQASVILKTQPKDWNLCAMVGDACLQEKQYPQAEQYYRKAKQLCQTPPERLRMNLRLARLYEQQREYSKVEAVYLEVLKENPTNLIALNNLAYAYIDQLDRPEDGLKLIEQAIKAVPGDPNLVDTYAWALARMGRIDEALPIFEQIITRASSSPDSLYHMGYVLEQSGDLTEARNYYRRALEMLKTKQNHPLQTKVQTALSRMEQTLSKE